MIGPKCIHCKKNLVHHSKSKACPVGKKHRLLGFIRYSQETRFEAKEPKARGSAESRKDREVRREVKSNPCCACGTRGTDWNPVDPAHIRTFKVTQSDHPANMIPLCRDCHRTQHSDGWAVFLANNQNVAQRLMDLGWDFTDHPFEPGKLILTHPEVA
jgi:hypothetical protein